MILHLCFHWPKPVQVLDGYFNGFIGQEHNITLFKMNPKGRFSGFTLPFLQTFSSGFCVVCAKLLFGSAKTQCVTDTTAAHVI